MTTLDQLIEESGLRDFDNLDRLNETIITTTILMKIIRDIALATIEAVRIDKDSVIDATNSYSEYDCGAICGIELQAKEQQDKINRFLGKEEK